jgi:hypothetical protein
MAQRFKAKTLISNSGVFNNEVIAPNLVYNTGSQTVSGNKSFVNKIYLNNENDSAIGGTSLEGNISGISLKTFQNPTDITIRSDFIGGNNDEVISIRNSYYTDPIFGSSINTAGFGDQIVIYQTGSSYGVPRSKGPYIRLGENNIISEKSTSKLGIGTLFPTEKVHISGGNLKVEGTTIATNLVYNTGNQIISGVKTFANGSNQILNTTYSNLTGLKATSGLLSGQLYRISDFVLKWNNQSINDQTVKTAVSGEPLIVTALSNNKIYHIAQSETYPQDTIYYNIDASGSYSWGAINNTAAIPDFKGWIYRRVDNLLDIDIPYDWRNITVNCCKPDVSSVPNYSGNYSYTRSDYVKETGNNSNRGKLYYSVATGNSGNALNNTNFWNPVSSFVESGTFFSTDENNTFVALYDDVDLGDFRINLPFLTTSRIQQPTFTSTLTGLGAFTLSNVKNIKIEGGYSNVIIGDFFQSNTIGNNFYLNTIGLNFYNNTIGNTFVYNIIGVGFYANTIGQGFSSNTIGNSFQTNNIGISFNSNTIGESFSANTMGYAFSSNTIGSSFVYNTMGYGFSSNTIGNSFNANTIGNSFNSNTVGTTFHSNTIGNIFQSNNIANAFTYNTIGNYFEGNTIGTTYNLNTIGNIFQNNAIQTNFTYNTIGNYFNSNTIGHNFVYNTIGSSFESNTVGNSFNNNISEDSFNSINFTSSTHVYNSYNTTLFQNSANSMRLRYFNNSDQLVVTDPTA